MNTRIIISVLLCAALLTVVRAEISVDSDSDSVFFCDLGTKSFRFNVTNFFNEAVTLTVSKAGSITQFADVHFLSDNVIGSTIDLNLLPGETRVVTVLMTLNKEVSYGEKELLVNLDWGVSITKSFKVLIKNCHSLVLSADPSLKQSCLLTPVEYVVNVMNAGPYDEDLFLELAGEGLEYARVSTELLELREGDSKNVYVFFYPTRVPGDFTTVLNVGNDFVSESLTLNSAISKCADFQVSVGKSVDLCEGDEEQVVINISNTGVVADTYSFSAESPLETSFSKSKISLSPGESDSTSLNIFSECGREGVFNVSVTVTPEEALEGFETELSASVDDCYNHDLLIPESRLMCVCEIDVYNLTLRNKGVFEQEYLLFDDSRFMNLLTSNITLVRGGEAVIPVEFSTCEPGEYEVRVSALEKSSCERERTRTVRETVLSEEECFAAKISVQDSYELNPLSQYNIPISVRNQGLRHADYSFSFSGSASSWVYAVSEQEMSVRVNEDSSFNILVIPPAEVDGNKYSLVVNVLSDGSLVSSKTIDFTKTQLVPQIISETTASTETVALEYFLLVLVVFTLAAIILNWGFLVSFLRKHVARLYNGRKRGKKQRKKKKS